MRQWRVGTFSMGLLLIAFGVLLLGNTLWHIDMSKIIVYGWPIILILLGLEVLLFSLFKKEGRLKFDFFSIFILFLAIMFTFVIYSVQETGIFSAIHKTIYDSSYTIDINKSLELDDSIDEVEVNAPNGSLSIIGNESNNANITGTIRISAANKAEADKLIKQVLSIKTIGNKAIIRIENSDSINLFDRSILKANLHLSIPKDKNIKANLVNGDIDLRQMNCNGDITGVNGKITLEDVEGNYEIKTVNGELSFHNIQGDLDAKTTNGKINVNNVAGALNISSVNSKIKVNSDKVLGDWYVETVNGTISLEIPNKTNATISAKSTIGNITGNIPWADVDKSENIKLGANKKAILGDGTYSIKLESQHGELSVNTK